MLRKNFLFCASLIMAISCSSNIEKIIKIINSFQSENRNFLVMSSNHLDGKTFVDISHESLICQWSQLRRWAKEEAENAKFYLRLAETAQLYNEGKAGLLLGVDLHIAENWYNINKPNKAWANRYHPEFEKTIQFILESQKSAKQTKTFKWLNLLGLIFIFIFLFFGLLC